MSRRLVPISELAAYAADPDGFKARRGGAISSQAASFGADYHDAFGRRPPARSTWAGYVMVILAVICGVVLYSVLTR